MTDKQEYETHLSVVDSVQASPLVCLSSNDRFIWVLIVIYLYRGDLSVILLAYLYLSYSKVFKGIQKYSKVFRDTRRYSKVF